MTTDLASFPKKYLETFWSRVDVYVNIDLAAGNQVLTAMFFFFNWLFPKNALFLFLFIKL